MGGGSLAGVRLLLQRRLLSFSAACVAHRSGSLAVLGRGGMAEKAHIEPNGSPPPVKRRLLLQEKKAGLPEEGEKRYVPPPKKRNPGTSFSEAHFAETSCYFEGGLRKVRPYYFDFETYCKGRWVGRSLLDVFSSEFRAQPLDYYRAAASAGRLRLNEQPVRDLSVVLKASEDRKHLLKQLLARPIASQQMQHSSVSASFKR